MKKLLFVFVALLVGGAHADNIITSREYVDAQANTLQTTLPAKNTNTVLINTNTAGEVGEKAIYDSTASYAEQTDALVTAGAFNTAVQNALESEFVCIERQNGNGGCLLYEIRSATQNQMLPTGYTQLEYLESTGTQYIDTQYTPSNLTGIKTKAQFDSVVSNESIVFGSGQAYNLRNFEFYLWDQRPEFNYHSYKFGSFYMNIDDIIEIDWDKNIVKHAINSIPQSQIVFQNTDFTSPYSMLLFALQRPNLQSFGKIKMYYFVIYDNGSLVHNFIPARRDSDNTLGMYDTVTNTFFTNSGTGEFIAGPTVSSNLYLPSGN